MDNNSLDNKELEQLRSEYAILKSRIEKQEIINDRLMVNTFRAKVKDIHSVSWSFRDCGRPLLFPFGTSLHVLVVRGRDGPDDAGVHLLHLEVSP